MLFFWGNLISRETCSLTDFILFYFVYMWRTLPPFKPQTVLSVLSFDWEELVYSLMSTLISDSVLCTVIFLRGRFCTLNYIYLTALVTVQTSIPLPSCPVKTKHLQTMIWIWMLVENDLLIRVVLCHDSHIWFLSV